MKVGDVLELNIIDDNHLGNGIAKYKDMTIFVPFSVKGDTVKVEITNIHKNIANAKVLNNNLQTKCPYYEKCGGCNLLHVPYERELELKKNYIKKLFKEFDIDIVSFDREHYRNKVTFHVKNGILGLYEEDSNDIINIDNCLLLDNDINKQISKIKTLNLKEVEELVIKKASNGILISIIGSISKDDLKVLKEEVNSIYINNELVYGEEFLIIDFNDISYNINNNSFFQINEECAEALYDYVKEEVGKCNSLLDLYCGTGSIGIYLSNNVKEVTGIEINQDSIKCAEKNIKLNNIKNYKIVNSDASCIDDTYDVVVVDPPRSGLSKNVISILNNMDNKKLIYISCNPSTLRRDIDLLDNYNIKKVSVFNMFPGTKHIESLLVLERKN